jgi:hypothetical protein
LLCQPVHARQEEQVAEQHQQQCGSCDVQKFSRRLELVRGRRT